MILTYELGYNIIIGYIYYYNLFHIKNGINEQYEGKDF